MVAVEYRLEEPHVGGAGRVKPSMTAAKDNRRLGQFLNLTVRRCRIFDRGQSIQLSLIGDQ